jgi:hypothetical protein
VTFLASTSPDISEGMPASLAQSAEAAVAVSNSSVWWDISIDGMGFILGINDQNKYVRESAPIQKQQLDTSREAGEQTLDGLWIRSQTSWHLGAGVTFYEPAGYYGTASLSAYRYLTSVGIDPWTEGQLSLLKATSLVQSSGTSESFAASARFGGADYYFTQTGGTVNRWTAGGVSTAYTPSVWTPTGRIAVAGSKILVGGTSFGIFVGDVNGSTLGPLYSQAINTTPVPYWAKSRIIAVRKNVLFELALDGSSGTTPGNLDTVTPLYTHPDPGWTWTDVTETPTAILASGYSGSGQSAVYSFTLETNGSGSTPKLGQPFQVLELPPGEEILACRVYLGIYVGIGTSLGLRVGVVSEAGKIQIGPLLFKAPVSALGARDSFMYAGASGAIDGSSGCARVDLSNQIGNDLVFPWAWDANTHDTGTVQSVAFVGNSDRVVVAVGSKGVYAQSATVYEPSGYLTSGAIRYGTTEGKAFRLADLRADSSPVGAAVALDMIGPSGEDLPIVTLGAGASGSNVSLGRLPQGFEFASYRLTLTRSTSTTVSPSVQSIAIKAVPVVAKQRMIQYPVLFQDQIRDGRKTPTRQPVSEKLLALEQLESEKAVVTVVDNRLGEQFPAVIETIHFESSTPSTGSPQRGQANVGGRGAITVRRLV